MTGLNGRSFYQKAIPALRGNWKLIALACVFLSHLFLRFNGLETMHVYSWDQVDNSWAAKNILIDLRFQLVGMVAKQNSGFYIGPLYYYYVAFFYWLFDLDPIASVYIAGVTSIVTFFVLYVFIKKLFSEEVALVALFVHTFSSFIIAADRVQWPVNFLAPISIIIFYLCYQVILGKEKYILYLAIALGISWQLNFTSIFFFIISLCLLPFFPRTRKMIIQLIISIPLLLVFFVPNVIYDMQNKSTSARHLNMYLSEYYHGFHFTRMMQLAKDAFIEFAALFQSKILAAFRYTLLPVFFFLYLRQKASRKKLLFCYLVLLWFLIPWLVFTAYKGEISNYYFSLTRPIVLMLLGYIVVWLLRQKNIFINSGIIISGIIFAVINIRLSLVPIYRPLSYHKKIVFEKISSGQKVDFQSFNPDSYIYYVFFERKEHDKESAK